MERERHRPGTLLPVPNEYGVAFRVMHGFASATAVHEAAEESQVRFTVLYVGDHDPTGMYMSEVDLPQRLERYDADIDILRIALLPGDVHGLPHFDLASKRSDARYDWYRRHYGNRCWELDAMNPVDLRQRAARMIREFIDWPAWEHAQKAEAAEIATIEHVLARWRRLFLDLTLNRRASPPANKTRPPGARGTRASTWLCQ